MKLNFIGTIILVLSFSLLLTSCNSTNSTNSTLEPQKKCQRDTDCVLSECCHANDVVNKESAQNCESIICSLDCVPNTLDCGQGEIKCIKNQCRAIIYS